MVGRYPNQTTKPCGYVDGKKACDNRQECSWNPSKKKCGWKGGYKVRKSGTKCNFRRSCNKNKNPKCVIDRENSRQKMCDSDKYCRVRGKNCVIKGRSANQKKKRTRAGTRY